MYTFPTEARKVLEAMPVPLAYYQRDGEGRIVATGGDELIEAIETSGFDQF